jgi:2'-5' RNA ligase
MPAAKYFIAIVLPEPLLSRVEGIKQNLFAGHGLKGALLCPAHITLHRPFEWKEEKEGVLIEKLQNFVFQEPFSLELRNFAFFEPRVIYVDVLASASLVEMHKQLTSFAKRELRLFNEYDDLRGFHPHVTIASRDLKKNLFFNLKDKFANEEFNGGFEYSGFSLLKKEKQWKELYRINAKP